MWVKRNRALVEPLDRCGQIRWQRDGLDRNRKNITGCDKFHARLSLCLLCAAPARGCRADLLRERVFHGFQESLG